jgi:superfamily II RNA helicase
LNSLPNAWIILLIAILSNNFNAIKLDELVYFLECLVFVNAEQTNAMKLRQLWYEHNDESEKVYEKVRRIILCIKAG